MLAPVLIRIGEILKAVNALLNEVLSDQRFRHTKWVFSQKKAWKLCHDVQQGFLLLNTILSTHITYATPLSNRVSI